MAACHRDAHFSSRVDNPNLDFKVLFFMTMSSLHSHRMGINKNNEFQNRCIPTRVVQLMQQRYVDLFLLKRVLIVKYVKMCRYPVVVVVISR